SQYEEPVAQNGFIDIDSNGQNKRIGIRRIHMEEDAGKLTHDPHQHKSLVDYNRTGVPLIEIVSDPDIRSPQESVDYLKKLRLILRYLDICDGNMEEGSFRCDANISIRLKDDNALGTRTELKNLNSFKFVEKALEFEIHRQQEILTEGGRIIQETRLYDPDRNITLSMREKEEAHDYRYFPDPDLLPLIIDEKWVETLKKSLPELPEVKKERYVNKFHLPLYDAEMLTSSRELAEYFENCLKYYPQPKSVSNWIMGPLTGLLNLTGKTVFECPVSPETLAKLLQMINNGLISQSAAKIVFDEMARTGEPPDVIVEAKGLTQLNDTIRIEAVVKKVLSAHPKEVQDYKAGKSKLLGFFVGCVMKETQGKANPGVVNGLVRKALSE
ncbi:MAG: Asp-tRNA(Asn)/Glu-tRNA(Gln) amidotransferase subunit GatB, partial [Thermodesulfobacteriota bacterium]